MEYLIPIATCLLVAVVSSLLAFDLGRHVQGYKDGEYIRAAIRIVARSIELYNDDENEEATLFITLEDKPAYTVTEIVLNDGESLRLYREERTI